MQARRRRGALLLGVLALAGCGTVLPNSAFTQAGSGAVVTATSSPSSAGASAAPSTGPSSSATGGTQARAGRAGTSGHTVTLPGQRGAAPAGAGSSSCSGTRNNDPAIGVTPTTLRIGIVYSGPANPFAPNQFVVSYYGVNSYVNYLDQALHGICGRTVQLYKCDDNGDSNQDVNCAHVLIDQDHVLALVGSNVFEYSGASYVSQSGVPDIGGQPVSGDAYYTYPHLYSILGSYYANTGSPPSAYWGPAGLGEYWKKTLHLTRAGVIYYAQTDSTRGANYIKGWLSNVGVRVDTEQVPLAGDPGPNVLDMQKKGDQAIFDALDLTGNQKVCQAMQNYGFNVPKISTISVWTQQLGQTMSGYPCLNNYYAWGMSSNYADTSNSQVSLFRQAYASFAPGAPISQWSLESWAAGMWFADAASACGNDVTRGCIEKYVNVSSGYAARGLLDTHTTFFPHWSSRPAHISQCYTIVKWAGGGNGTWGTVIDHSANCYTAPTFDYNS